LALTLLAQASPAHADNRDATYLAGGDGWHLERFGAELVVLRAAVVRLPDKGTSTGSVFLSCTPDERRLRLALPDPPAGLGYGPQLRGLLRGFPARDGAPVAVGAFSFDGRLLGAAGGRFEVMVARFADILRGQPAGIEWLLAPASGPVTPRRLTPVILGLAFRPGDAAVLDEVVRACRPTLR
jgi:hypothetical protein